MAKPNNSIIQITSSEISGETVQGVNARELHGFLGVGRDFSNWLKARIEEYDNLSRTADRAFGGAV